jgi:hypothetical protein
MNWRGCRRMQKWSNLWYCPDILSEELKKYIKILSQDSSSPGRDFNPGISEYGAEIHNQNTSNRFNSFENKRRNITQQQGTQPTTTNTHAH